MSSSQNTIPHNFDPTQIAIDAALRRVRTDALFESENPSYPTATICCDPPRRITRREKGAFHRELRRR